MKEMNAQLNFALENTKSIISSFGGHALPEKTACSLAQTQATLAVAYEQKLTNLIAWHAFVDAQGDLPDEAAELSAEITRRIGL